MFHEDVLYISYRHRLEIKKRFSDILGTNDIDHFSLDLVSPKGEMLFFSSTPEHGYEICSRGYGPYDGIISPRYYRSRSFYWWEEAYHLDYAKEITAIREGVLGFYHGFMLVRNWNGFYFIYSFASKNKKPAFKELVLSDPDLFLRKGDYIYQAMQNRYQDYCGNIEVPKIKIFTSIPHDKSLLKPQKNKNTLQEDSQVIRVDFKNKRRLDL